MKKTLVAIMAWVLLPMATSAYALEVGQKYYVRTALHAVRGNEIFWVNYTAPDKTILIKAGARVTITAIEGRRVDFEHNGKTYHLAVTHRGHSGSDELYSKYFTTKNVNRKIKRYPKKIRSRIEMGKAEKGMTKEQVLLAVGCPAVVDGRKTFNATLKEILAGDTWIYYYNRFNRWQAKFHKGKLVSIRN